MSQPETGKVKTSEDESVEFETLPDDEEITIPLQDREISDVWNIDIRDEQLENTQREDWLLPTEPMHGARPRQTGKERPPLIDNPALTDAEEIAADRDAGEISAVRHPSQTLSLSRGRRMFMEEEVFTPPRGAVRLLSLRVCHERYELCLKFVWRTVYEIAVKARGTSVEMLVNTVSHMQIDLAILREEKSRTKNTSHLTGDTGSPAGGAHDDESAAVRHNY